MLPDTPDSRRCCNRDAREKVSPANADPISTRPLEGVNSKIKLQQRRADGYRGLELFKRRVLARHTTRYELGG
ncbi:MAG: transposase [Planctomycetaceae bacterium]